MHPRANLAVATLAVSLVGVIGERVAHAQACCASTSVIFPARLADDENALIGIAARGAGVFGTYDSQRVLSGQPKGAGEADFAETLLVTVRPWEPLQINVAVPYIETFRSAPGQTDFGSNVGDIAVATRLDFIREDKDPVVPGIAALLSFTLPTGVPIEQSNNPLAADATGLGSAQVTTGLALEKIFGRTFFAISGAATFHGARTVNGVHSQLGPDLAATLGASYTFSKGVSFGGALTYMGSFDSTIEGTGVPDSARATTQISIGLAMPVRGGSRVLASVFFNPPMSGVGQNEPAAAGVSLTWIFGFHGRECCGCAGGMCPPRR